MSNQNSPLDNIVEQAFWDAFNERETEEERYVVVNTQTGDVLVKDARLIKEKRKIRV